MKKYFFFKWKRVDSDRSKLDLPDETIKISILVESYDEKTAENYRNCYVAAEKRIVLKLSKIFIPNFFRTNSRFEHKMCQNFTSPSFILPEK